MILTRQPGQTISLSMLLFVISGTWGYRSGIEMINVTFCGMLLFLNLAEKLFRKNLQNYTRNGMKNEKNCRFSF